MSEVIKKATKEGPQRISVHGERIGVRGDDLNCFPRNDIERSRLQVYSLICGDPSCGQKMPVKKDKTKGTNEEGLKEQIVLEFHIVAEGLISQIKQVAEGVVNIDQKLDRTREELRAEIEEKTDPIAQAVISLDRKVTNLDQKVTNLDQKVTNLDQKVTCLDQKVTNLDQKVTCLDQKVTNLDQKVNGLDEKLDRTSEKLRAEIQETRQEILAAVKFSYAELDRRLTTLEKDFLELRLRVEKIEDRSVS
jgi:chromosome segregation ATPase